MGSSLRVSPFTLLIVSTRKKASYLITAFHCWTPHSSNEQEFWVRQQPTEPVSFQQGTVRGVWVFISTNKRHGYTVRWDSGKGLQIKTAAEDVLYVVDLQPPLHQIRCSLLVSLHPTGSQSSGERNKEDTLPLMKLKQSRPLAPQASHWPSVSSRGGSSGGGGRGTFFQLLSAPSGG